MATQATTANTHNHICLWCKPRQRCDVKKKKWKMGSRPGSPFGLEDKAPLEPPGCLISEDLQTLHIPTNKKLEVWTQYRLFLSFFLGGYFSSFKISWNQEKTLRNYRSDREPPLVVLFHSLRCWTITCLGITHFICTRFSTEDILQTITANQGPIVPFCYKFSVYTKNPSVTARVKISQNVDILA